MAPLFGFHALILGPRSVNLRPPLPESAVFLVRNGVLHFLGELIILRRCWFFVFFFLENAISEVIFLFFAARQNFLFFSRLWRLGSWRRTPRGSRTRNASKQGVSERLAFLFLLILLWTRCIASILHNFSENNFGRSHKFVFFGSLNFWPNWVWKVKTAWGCRAEVVLKMTFFICFPGEDQLVKCLARGCVAFWVRVGLVAENGLAAAVRRFVASFSGFFFRHRFREFRRGSLEAALLFFSCFTLFCVFFLGLGSTQPCACVLGQFALNPSLFFCVFLQKHCFPLEQGYFCSFLCFFLLGFIHFSFSHSLSLSLSCFLFLSFLVVLFPF